MFQTATRKLAMAATAIAAALAATIGIAAAQSGDRSVSGSFVSTNFSGAGCASPIDACARGTFRGAIHGPFEAVALTIAPTAQPGVLVGTAEIVIHDPRGDLRCTETFVVNVTPGGDGEESFICQFTGGTGRWAGVTGHIEAFGSGGQHSSGRYEGRLVLAEP